MGGVLTQKAIEAIVDLEGPDALPVGDLQTEHLNTALSRLVDDQTAWQACSRVCKNNKHAQLVWALADVAQSSWGTLLAANCLELIRIFVTFVTVERIPIQFLYQQEVVELEDNPQAAFCFHRLVPVVFHYKSEVKTVYISIPQSQAFDFPNEQQRLLEEIRANFEALLVLGTQEQLLLLDDQKAELDVSSLVAHYSDYGKDQLVDPFSEVELVHKGPLHVWLETTMCKVNPGTKAGRMTRFLHILVDRLVKEDKDELQLKCSEAAVRLIFALLSSHLYTKSQSQDYSLAPKSPTLQIFHLLSPAKARGLVGWLLEWFMQHYEDKPKVQTSFLSRVWRTVRPK